MKIDKSNGMIAIYPTLDVIEKISPHCLNDYDQSDLHITLFYSKDLANMSEVAKNALRDSIKKRCPFSVELTGCGVFFPGIFSDVYVKILLFSSKEMDELQHCIYEIMKMDGQVSGDAYGFVPHMTLGYLEAGGSSAEIVNEALDRMSVMVSSLYITFGHSKPEQIKMEGTLK